MKKHGILNAQLAGYIAALGHKDLFMVGDAGMPIPAGVPIVDLVVMALAAEWLNAHMADGPLRSLLADGVIAGVGGVVVFLPQILILFFFILALEESGYLPRAAFLLDRIMGVVGLSGRSFIPLLSSFACAVPGIMATRSIPD